jgi:ribosomal protein S18 acetylase RimI-like enzyme
VTRINTSQTDSPEDFHIGKPTSEYSDDELAQIYSSARVDYIVPMPMNGKRMRQYIDAYNIDTDASIVSLDIDDHDPTGVIMLGVRGDRSWITRLGVLPAKRRRKTGQFLMNRMIEYSQANNFRMMQLEVIKGNDPARYLFEKLGFEFIRELLVIRRPPSKLDESQIPDNVADVVEFSDEETVAQRLENRDPYASWVEETQSIMNIGSFKGLDVTLTSGEKGWLIFQRSAFQLQHIVIQPDISHEMQVALLAQLHLKYPLQDTKVENVPADHPTWEAFQKVGYFDAFRRLEMYLYL